MLRGEISNSHLRDGCLTRGALVRNTRTNFFWFLFIVGNKLSMPKSDAIDQCRHNTQQQRKSLPKNLLQKNHQKKANDVK